MLKRPVIFARTGYIRMRAARAGYKRAKLVGTGLLWHLLYICSVLFNRVVFYRTLTFYLFLYLATIFPTVLNANNTLRRKYPLNPMKMLFRLSFCVFLNDGN